MKIVVIGASGIIGSAVAAALEKEHEVVRASRRGPVRVDMNDTASIDALFASVPDVDAVVCCAAGAPLTPLDSGPGVDVEDVVRPKLFGQVHLVRCAVRYLRDGGSATLTGGVFERPMAGGALGAMVNAGLEAFVAGAAIEMPRGLRLNVVSPGWVAETLESLGMDASEGTPVGEVVKDYVAAVEGADQGRTFRPSRPTGLSIE
ncbi:short chain dehydrogenase [Actinomadura rugatobispora]|uniref:Short chain dehydrogenase n=1 Tax=Actinomadura rugatobispora TaxID=1994 RepID=A0ABW0ZT89_9ACTN|nr:short chain dehydrogenase [Actinomadura rugatobispora]